MGCRGMNELIGGNLGSWPEGQGPFPTTKTPSREEVASQGICVPLLGEADMDNQSKQYLPIIPVLPPYLTNPWIVILNSLWMQALEFSCGTLFSVCSSFTGRRRGNNGGKGPRCVVKIGEMMEQLQV